MLHYAKYIYLGTRCCGEVTSPDLSSVEIPEHISPPPNKYHLKPAIEAELHDYQWELALPGLSGQNYIVCAPTGSGKTRVAGLVIAEHLQSHQGHGKVIFVVNKVPLVQQQRNSLQEMIHGAKLEEVCGGGSQHQKALLSASLGESSGSEEEGEKFRSHNDIIVCTAGCLLNELQKKQMPLSAISLLVMDECHNTRKNSNYARIMEMYIRAKMTTKVPQVMGLTATPGAGDSARPTIDTVLDHMTTLCAHMDATGGIKTVRRHVSELDRYQTSPESSRATVGGRSEEEPFIDTISHVSTQLERLYHLKPPTDERWTCTYTEWICGKLNMNQIQEKGRDKISLLRTLKSLSAVLKTYQNLCFEDAMDELDQLVFPSHKDATDMENHLAGAMKQLKVKLHSLDKVENPLLLQLEDCLVERFKTMPMSKAIVFVETKNEATSIERWIKTRPDLHFIHPDVMTGQTRDTGKKMTKSDQNSSLQGFRGSESNLLVSTSVLEEGVDVPACNLVIRYLKVTSEIAQVQSMGRARATDSRCITVLRSDSGKQFQEFLNDMKIELVNQALEILPSGENLCRKIRSKQRFILEQSERRNTETVDHRHLYEPAEVDIHCGNCSAFLCNGNNVRTIENTPHHVVNDEDFVTHVSIETHHTPTNELKGLSRTHKLRCAECKIQSLGVMGRWWRHEINYPVLKCSYIKFKVNGENISCKQWKLAPFPVCSLSES